MAFFGIKEPSGRAGRKGGGAGRAMPTRLLHQYECSTCPLNDLTGLDHPHMEPTGAESADVYFLAEAPGEVEDSRGVQLVGPSGQVVRFRLTRSQQKRIRWNNVVRTRPPKNRTPTPVEIECCRPSIIRDIENVKPKVLVGFGNIPLAWALEQSGITKWHGKRVPIKVGEHNCWFLPILHPSYVLRERRWDPRDTSEYPSEAEFAFALDLERALAFADNAPEPVVHERQDAERGVEFVTGENGARDLRRVEKFLDRAAAFDLVGVDYETTALRPYSEGARIATAAVSTDKKTLAFPLHHARAAWSSRERRWLDDAWRAFLYRGPDAAAAAVHNLAFEMEWSAHFYGRECLRASRWEDTMAQAYVLDERPGVLSLGSLCLEYFGIDIKKHYRVDTSRIEDVPLPEALLYNGVDASYHRRLFHAQAERLEEEGLATKYGEHLERVPTATLTQLKGIPVHQPTVKKLDKKYSRRMDKHEAKLRELSSVRKFERQTGERFRPSAPEDARHVITKILGIPVDNVNEETLSEVDHVFCRRLLRWRKAKKLHGTYVQPVSAENPNSRVFPDGLMHPTTKVNATRTSRTASGDPNYQNWPKRGTNRAIEIRGLVRPPSGYVVVSFDYGQIQARNVAMESRDPALTHALWNEYDIHTDWMEEIVRAYPDWVKEGARALARDPKLAKHYRQESKHGWVFASLFGAQPKSKSHKMGLPLSVAEQLDRKFWHKFSVVKKWHKRLDKNYRKLGYVGSLAGYRRRAPMSPNERINAPIQADEAEIVMDAMTRLSKIDYDKYQANMEIHDDLTFIWPKKKVDEYAEVVVREMLSVPHDWAKTVPIVVEMAIGDDWASLEDVEEFSSNKYEGIDMPKEAPKWARE